MYGGGGSLSHLHPTGGWYHNAHTGYYHNMFGQGTMSGSTFASSTPYLSSHLHTRTATAEEVAGAIGTVTGTTASYLSGTDPLGSRYMILESPTGKLRAIAIPFWQITGSYYNELYYFSGLVAFDTYQAQRELVATGASVDLTFAIGPVGFSIETGSLDYYGGVHRFFSIGTAIGLEASISMNKINIREFSKGSFTPQNYAGWNTTTNSSLTYFTYGRESALQYTQSPYNTYGYKANHYSFGIGVLPIGLSEVRTYTWVGKRKERYQYKFYDFK